MELLAENAPLACVPFLGQGLVEYWFSHLACAGVKELLVLADDRPDQIRALVGNGARWGIKAEVIEETRELTAAQALLKYEKQVDASVLQNGIAVLDSFPGRPEQPLFGGYPTWFAAMKSWLPHAKTPDRVGVLDFAPGVQVGLHSQISPEAQLRGPCWIGKNVFIGARAVIGPDAIVEDGCFIEAGATVVNSVVGRDTFVGQLAEITGSLAAGDTLVNLETGSSAKVPDRFLLCSLRRTGPSAVAGLRARLAELCSRNEGHLVWKHLLLNRES
jgi:NDP-sugar pyrophosphorylase family protein